MFKLSRNPRRPIVTLAALGLVILALAAFGGPAASATRPLAARTSSTVERPASSHPLHFFTLNDQRDATFNQLLGINDTDEIAGYFGSGAAGHPNKGYTLVRPYGQGNYTDENFPGSAQTQVVAINNRYDTAGFWVDANGNNFGFIKWNGVFTSYRDPNTGTGTVNQILGLNDAGIAVGFYTDGNGLNHGFALNRATGKFYAIVPPRGNNVTAAGINDSNDVTGFRTARNGNVVDFLLKGNSFFEKTGATQRLFNLGFVPQGIAVDRNHNHIFVSDYNDNAIMVYTLGGQFVTTLH